jgi:glycerol-3-phosphate O-acyltransferase
MNPTVEINAHADQPVWPSNDPDREVVFLLDAASSLERDLLEAWVQAALPAQTPPGRARMVALPPSRGRRRPGVDPALEAVLAAEDDPLLAPLRVVWIPPERDGVRAVRPRDLLTFSDPRDPGTLRQRWILRRHPDRCRIVLAEPAPVSDLRTRWAEAGHRGGGTTTGLSLFVSRQAALSLERSERRLRGMRYKVPKLVEEEILGAPAFRARVTQLARQESRSEADINRQTVSDLREIAAAHSPLFIDLVAWLIRKLYTQGYADEIQYDREQLGRIAALSQRSPVVFLPTHKSNLDHLALQYILYENGLPPNHTAGGINMNFFPVGPLVRRTGTFFIRRSFRDDAVYKHVLRSYIDYLVEKRFSLEWYIEGGRSRSGKLLPPRFGMLAYVVDAWRRGKSENVQLIPVAIAYDQIQEVGGYSDEQEGASKEKESFGWFLGVIRSLRRPYGRIHIRFGEPISLRSQLEKPERESGADPDESEIELQKLAFEVSVRINRVTPITPISLVTLALLGTGDRAATVGETRQSLVNLLRYVQERKLPTTAQLYHLESDAGVRRTLEALAVNDVVTRFDGGPECVYRIGPEQQLAAAYYRNTVIHFFVNAAIAELALVHAGEGGGGGDSVAEFWDETMRLRDLFKFEFFFAEKNQFREEIRDELAFQDTEWGQRLASGPDGAHALLRGTRPFTAHRVIRPFIESYRVVSDALQQCAEDAEIDRDALVSDCLGLGKQYQLQERIQSRASVSKVLFGTALKLADNRRLVECGAPGQGAARAAFAEEIRDVHRRVEVVVALAASRRAGLID